MTIRNLDDEVYRQLKIRAAENGRSAEAEVRDILRETLGAAGSSQRKAEKEALMARLSEALKTRPLSNDSTQLLREERDRRAGIFEE